MSSLVGPSSVFQHSGILDSMVWSIDGQFQTSGVVDPIDNQVALVGLGGLWTGSWYSMNHVMLPKASSPMCVSLIFL